MSPRIVAVPPGSPWPRDPHRRTLVARFAAHGGSQLPQRLQQVADRPGPHARDCRPVDSRPSRWPAWRSGTAWSCRCWPRTDRLGDTATGPHCPARGSVADRRPRRPGSPTPRGPRYMTRVSSLSSAPCERRRSIGQCSADQARFVMLLEPGGRTVACTGPIGRIGSTLVAVMCRYHTSGRRRDFTADWPACRTGRFPAAVVERTCVATRPGVPRPRPLAVQAGARRGRLPGGPRRVDNRASFGSGRAICCGRSTCVAGA